MYIRTDAYYCGICEADVSEDESGAEQTGHGEEADAKSIDSTHAVLRSAQADHEHRLARRMRRVIMTNRLRIDTSKQYWM